MRSLRTALIITALSAAAPMTAMAQATSSVERVVVHDYFDEIPHPCNGELVTLVGTLNVTTRRTVDPHGVVHLSITVVPHIRGEGPSGEYIVRDAPHVRDKFIDGEQFPDNESFKAVFHLVGKGKAPNFLYTGNAHVLVEADGTVKVDFAHEVAKCTS